MKTLSKLTFLVLATVFVFNSCKKESISQIGNSNDKASRTSLIPDSMILTPAGMMPKSQVHLIENGYRLEIRANHVLKVKIKTGELMEDFGKIQIPVTIQNKTFQNSNSSKSKNLSLMSPSGNGWVTYSEWGNTNSQPINYFSTSWTVPSNPTTNDGQLLYIWDGLEPYKVQDNNPNNLVIQPVLQWGSNGSGSNTFGGQYWTISNWCVWSGGGAYTTPITNIAVGTNIQGSLSFSGNQANGSYNYSSYFNGYSNTMNVTQGTTYNNLGGGNVNIPMIPIENWAYEVLEVFNVSRSTDYPLQHYIRMTNITLTTGAPNSSTPASLQWAPIINTPIATFGEHTDIFSSNPSGSGEVDLYFHSEVAPNITYTNRVTFYAGVWTTPLTPTNTGDLPMSYQVNPALPAGLSLNTSTGVISGAPTSASAAINYVVTATNSAGSSSFTINITVNTGFPFQVSTGSSPSIYFDVAINGGSYVGTGRIGQGQQSVNITVGGTRLSNSTVVVRIPTGAVPTSAGLYNLGAPIYGTISGNLITFSNVNLASSNGPGDIVLN
ncbi:MAG: hypothetical protein JWQ84_348 [Mucilaginibacter sp.]|nr:hypothetical protein [Mucilaginibacter sp.]